MKVASLRTGSFALALASFFLGCGNSNITVSGAIVDDREMPIVGARVRIGDRVEVTGPDGRFAIREVATPYDVSVVSADKTQGTLFEGVELKEPRFRAFSAANAVPRGARMHFVFPTPLGEDEEAHTFVLLADTEATLLTQTATRNGGAYDVDVRYVGPTSLRVWAFALRYEVEHETRSIKRYVSHQWRPIEFVEGTTVEWQGQGYLEPSTQTVTVETSVPEGYALTTTNVRYRPPAPLQDVPVFLTQSGTRAQSTFAIPVFDGSRVDIEAVATGPNGSTTRALRRFVTGGSNVKLDLFAGPSATEPGEGALASAKTTRFECVDAGTGHFAVTLRPSAEEFRSILPTLKIVAKNCRANFSPLVADVATIPNGAAYELLAMRSSVGYDDVIRRDAPFVEELKTAAGAKRAIVLSP